MISPRKKALDVVKLLETKTSVYDLEVEGVNIWWFIRVYFWLMLVNTLDETIPVQKSFDKESIYRNYLRVFLKSIFVFLIRSLKGFILSINLKKTHSEVMFLVEDYSLRLNNGHGIQNHVFFGTFYPYFEKKSIVVEVLTEKSLNSDSLKNKEGIIFSDYAYLMSFFRILPLLIRKKRIKNFQKFAEDLDALDLDAKMKKWILKTIQELMEMYRNKTIMQIESSRIILSKFKPKVIAETVSYNGGIMAFNYAARQQKIGVIEFQHGVISESHIGYKYFIPSNYSGILPLPDKVFLFGEAFKESMLYGGNGFSEKNLVVTGFPRISSCLLKSELERGNIFAQVRTRLRVQKDDFLVLVTDQTLFEASLYEFLKETVKLLPDNVILCIKVHPFTKKEGCIYDDLGDSRNIRIVDDKSEDLYNLLLASDVHCTISSTVFLEAMAIGKPNMILKLPGYESVIELINEGDALFVSSEEQFITLLGKVKRDLHFRHSLISHSKELSKKFFSNKEKPQDIITDEINKFLQF